ncbi:MAG: proteasome subunit alpha [Verrucomicrobiales bacterium]
MKNPWDQTARLPGDFAAVLERWGFGATPSTNAGPAEVAAALHTEATTTLAFKFSKGILMAADRRATAGNRIVYEEAEKVLVLDPHTVMAIAGTPATAWEMARNLEHSFQYFRRSQLQELSLEGKVRALSRLLRDNLGLVMQGIGTVVPLLASFDHGHGRLFFYDPLGAQFEVASHACGGSGSSSVRALLHYQERWGEKPLGLLMEREAIRLAIRALEIAAQDDSATGGTNLQRRVMPSLIVVDEQGVRRIEAEMVETFCQEDLQ